MIIGHQKQLNYLKRMAESGKIPHALLFSGQEKLGKKTIALEFISRLFEEPGVPKILGGRHPDFILIEPQGKQIQIDQIRDLSWRLSLKPIKAQLKAAIIDESHSMTREAQNCFLKTLEEPKGNTLLILVTEKPNFLLPTIISRCQIIKFYPVKKDEIERYLKNQGGSSKGEIEEIAKISQGRPGRAVELASSKEKFEFYKKRTKELDEILNSNLATRFQYAKDLSRQENLREILEIWLNYFRNIFIKNCSSATELPKEAKVKMRTKFSSPTELPKEAKVKKRTSSSSPTELPKEAKVKKRTSSSSPTELPKEAKVKMRTKFSSPTEPQRGEGGDEGKLRGRQTSSTSLEHLKNILQQIQRAIYLISTTNINPRLALEILMLELQHPASERGRENPSVAEWQRGERRSDSFFAPPV